MYPGGGGAGGFNIPPGPGGYPGTQQPSVISMPPGKYIFHS